MWNYLTSIINNKRRKQGSNKQINGEDGIDHVIKKDDDRNLHNIDNVVNSDGASDDASSNSQESNRSSLVHDHSDDSDYENCSFESKLQLDDFDIYTGKRQLQTFVTFLARGLGVKVKGRVEKQDCNEQ